MPLAIEATVVSDLESAVVEADAAGVSRAVGMIATMAVGAMLFGRRERLRVLHEGVEQIFAERRVTGFDRESPEFMAGQLASLTSFLAAAKMRGRPPEVSILLEDGAKRNILIELARADRAFSNAELAEAIGCSDATIARNIPILRAAKLVETRRDWKRKLNKITNAGRNALAAAAESDKPAEPLGATLVSSNPQPIMVPRAKPLLGYAEHARRIASARENVKAKISEGVPRDVEAVSVIKEMAAEIRELADA